MIFSINYLCAWKQHDVYVVKNVIFNVILALQLTQGFELYAVFGPLVTKPAAIAAINKLLRWIKKEEEHLFILSSVTFWLGLDIRIWNILVFVYTCSSELNLCVDRNALNSEEPFHMCTCTLQKSLCEVQEFRHWSRYRQQSFPIYY